MTLKNLSAVFSIGKIKVEDICRIANLIVTRRILVKLYLNGKRTWQVGQIRNGYSDFVSLKTSSQEKVLSANLILNKRTI